MRQGVSFKLNILKDEKVLLKIGYIILLTLVILLRCSILHQFGFKYADSDQSIMWLAAKDYASGVFHEPRFYGQNYNSMLEALLAVPLIKLSVHPFIALPLITAFLSFFPYLIISFILFYKKLTFQACAVISIPLLLPVEYDMITSLSRGFVTGIFIASIGCISILNERSKWGFFFMGFLGIIGFSLNPNSLVLTIPCILYLLTGNYTRKEFYIYMIPGILLASSLHFLSEYFYYTHSYFNLHKQSFDFSFLRLFRNLFHPGKYFNYVTPLFWKHAWVLFILCGIALFFLLKQKQYKKTFFLGSFFFLLFFSLGLNKTWDGTGSVFFSYSRMFLAFPVFIALFIAILKVKNNWFGFSFLLIPILFFAIKSSILVGSIESNIYTNMNHVVTVEKISDFLEECENIKSISAKYNVNLIVISNHRDYDFINYGCPACMEGFPPTLRPVYERRTWRLIEDENKTYQNVLIIDSDRKLDEQYQGVMKIPEMNGLYLIRDNPLRTMELLDSLKIPVRKFKN